MNRLPHMAPVMRNAPTFRGSLDYDVHGKNCADIFCVLPQCVNFKLRTRHVSTSRKDKPDSQACGASADTTANILQLQNSNNDSNVASLGRAILDHDAEKQLLDELEEYERFLERQVADMAPQPGFSGCFGIEKQTTSFPLYNPKEDCQVPRQTDSLHCYSPKRDGQTPGETARNHQPYSRDYGAKFEGRRSTFMKPSNSAVRLNKESDEDPFFPSFYEQFASIDQFTVPVKRSGDIHAAKRTRKDSSMTKTMPVPAFIVGKKTACHFSSASEQFLGTHSDPSRMVFGILAQILHMFEKPMSAEAETFFVHVLQKALREIQNVKSRESIK